MEVNVLKDDDSLNRNDGTEESTHKKTLRYTLTKRPPVIIIISAGLQHVLMCLPNMLVVSFILSDGVCAGYDSPVRTKLFSSTLLMCGICTLLQTALGVRLPILQGPSMVFMSIIIAAQKQDQWLCTDSLTVNMTNSPHNSTSSNSSDSTEQIKLTQLTQDEKLRQLSGSLMAASLIEILMGGSGLIGLLIRFIGPITVAPTISLLGLSLYKIPLRFASASWELTLAGFLLVIIFVAYLSVLRIPIPSFLRKCRTNKKSGRSQCHVGQMFQLIPVLLSVLVVWCISGILTHFNVFPNEPSNSHFRARTDAKSQLIKLAPWFYMPYPGQFGIPSFNTALFIGFIGGFFASMIESVGDYFAAANACEVRPPPNHAVSRGLFMEGLGGLLSGAVGVGHATTSYSGNIAALTLTRTANRTVLYCAGTILIILSVVGKFGAVVASIPDPALGGALGVAFAMLVAVGLSNLQYINLHLPRNLLILGVAFFTGIMVPEWVNRSPKYISTGSLEADNILKILLGTPMILGGVIAMVLDNTIRGSRKDRGFEAWQKSHGRNVGQTSDQSLEIQTYGWPWQLRLYRYIPWCSKLPFMPSVTVTGGQNGCDTNLVTLVSSTDETV